MFDVWDYIVYIWCIKIGVGICIGWLRGNSCVEICI